MPQPKKTLIALIGAVLICGLAVSGFLLFAPSKTQKEKAKFSLASENGSGVLIGKNEKLILKTNLDFSEKEIGKLIVFTPSVPFNIKKIKNKVSLANFVSAAEGDNPDLVNVFEIVPTDLAEGEVYGIEIASTSDIQTDHEYSWAFQVKALFQAVSSLPGDKSSDVPVNTGIEIRFNRDKLKDYADKFLIEPTVAGEFALQYDTLTFVPKGDLLEKTLYTVSLKKGITRESGEEKTDEDFVFSFETEAKKLDDNNKEYIGWANDYYELQANEKSFFPVYASNSAAPEVTIFKFEKSEDFRQEYFRYRNRFGQWSHWNEESYVPEKAIKIKSFKPALITDDWRKFIEVPDELANGYYVLEINYLDRKEYAFAQKSPLAYYYSLLHENSLLWIYDYEEKAPAGNLQISYIYKNGEKSIGASDANGVLEFATPEEMKAKKEIEKEFPVFFEAKQDGVPPFVIIANDVNLEKSDKYWNHLLTDRPIYQLSDKINFWGAVKGREMELFGKKLTIGLYQNWDTASALQQKEATVSPSGTYSGALDFAGIDPGYYSLVAKYNDDIISRAGLQILSYAKPLYKLEVSTDKENYWTGESVKFKVKAEFFDGTPLANAKLNYDLFWQKETKGQISLDAKGQGEVAFTLEYYFNDSDEFWTEYPQSLGIHFSPSKSEEGEISGEKYVSIFGPNLHIQAHAEKVKDSQYKIEAKASKLEIGNDNYIGEAKSGLALSAKIIKNYYLKKEINEVYDPISKKKNKQYEYELKNETVETINGVTDTEGKWVFEKDLPKIEYGWYRIIFSAKDDTGKNIKTAAYVGYDYYPGGQMYLGIKNPDTEANKYPDGYKIGDPINLEAYTQGEGELIDKKIMFYRFTDKMQKVEITENLVISDIFKDEYAPSVRYTAVAVGPDGFLESGTEMIVFDRNEKKLDITIEPDKEGYRPKEKVGLTFNIKDKDKNNVKAALNVSVVDEALFNILPSYQSDILSSVYTPLSSWPISRWTVFRSRFMGAEKGGGSGSGGDIRANFIDVPLFQELQSDENGNAYAEFIAPDNITGWRVSANAFESSKLLAGSNAKIVPVGLPIFTDIVLNKFYLSGDAPVLKLRAFGSGLKEGQAIEFSLKSAELGLDEKVVSLSSEVEILPGVLKTGKYKILAGIKQGENSDTIEREISVLDNYFRRGVSEKIEITAAKTAIPGNPNGFTHVAFVDGGNGKYFSDIINLAYSADLRSDRQAAAYYARKLLEKYFGKNTAEAPLDISQFYHAGISLLPYGDDDLELSAKLSDIAKENVSGIMLKNYFYSQLDNKKTDIQRIAIALYGLSALGEPVLDKVDYLKNSGELDDEIRIYLALTMAKLGAGESARELYREASKGFGEYKGGVIMKISEDENHNLEITAMAGVLASYLDEKADLEKIWTTLSSVDSNKLALELAKMMIIQNELNKSNPEKSGFNYKTASQSGAADLSEGKSLALYLSVEDLKSLEFSDISGKPVAIAYYEISEDPANLAKDANIGITRRYFVAGKETKEFKDGELVQIRLDERIGANALQGEYDIIDFLPAGLKPITDVYSPYLSNDDSCNPIWHPLKIVDNAVYFSIGEWFIKTDACPHRTLNYYARVVNKGEFRAEPAIIQSADNDRVLNLSEEGRVIVK